MLPKYSVPKSLDTESSQNARGCTINQFELPLLQKIFSYMNAVEMIVIVRVCSKWKKILDKSSELLVSMDLSSMPRRINGLNFMKILTKSQNLRDLILHETMSNTDTLS